MRFSVIVPIYNASLTLDRCISSVLCQTYTNFELILVDDGSADNSLLICRNYENIDSRVVVLHQGNRGHTAARQAGLESAKGDYILFLDSDDWFEPDLLKDGAAAIGGTHCELLLFGHCAKYENENTDMDFPLCSITGVYNTIKQSPLFPQLIMDERGRAIPRALWGKIYARDLIKKWLPLVPNEIMTGEDMCCFLACAKEATGVVIISGVYYNYQVANGTTSRKGDPLALSRCRYTVEFLASYIADDDPEIQLAVDRLVIQQMYSALTRELLAGKRLTNVRQDLKKLKSYAASKKALLGFSSVSAGLRLKHFLIKHDMVIATKMICLLRKKGLTF